MIATSGVPGVDVGPSGVVDDMDDDVVVDVVSDSDV